MKPLLLRNALFGLLLCGAALIIPACSRNDAAPQAVQSSPASASRHGSSADPEGNSFSASVNHWYWFAAKTDGSIRLQGTENIGAVPQAAFRPWTESVRIADCSFNNEALFLINKCGVYPLKTLQQDALLSVQHSQLAAATAADMYTVGGEVFTRIYQDSAFLPPEKISNASFLLKYNAATASCTSVADAGTLRLPEQAQCKSLIKADGHWYASFKTDNGVDISFSYIKCRDFADFMQPEGYQHCELLSQEAFRAACEPLSYDTMPKMVKMLADLFDNPADAYIRLRSDTGVQGEVFLKPAQETGAKLNPAENPPINAAAFLYSNTQNQQSAALLLPDGTFLSVVAQQEPKTLHLPVLPTNFRYTSFLITGTDIIAAWEESVFYGVGRTGFFTAALADIRE